VAYLISMTDDDGHAISWKVLKRGTPVRSSDGVQIGTVRRAQETGREHMFDGIVIDTKAGKRFVDAPEVARIAERAVTLTITAQEADELPPPGGGMRQRMDHAKTVRRAKRFGRGLRERWDRR
jgi:putative intracellular protease/amidase